MYKLAKVIARALIVIGFCSMIYVFAIQTRYLQPDYRVPHPELGRTAPLMFKGIVRYLTPDERAIFQYGFLFGISVAAIGAILG
jgi:hypothetical protein